MNTIQTFAPLLRAKIWLLAASCLLGACGPRPDATLATKKPESDPMVVHISPAMANRFQVAPVQQQTLEPLKEVAGRIEANDRLVTRIGASVTGRVTEVLVEVGDRVRPGQALARVASAELSLAQMAYLRAHSASSLADRAVERARQLYQADVIGQAELQRRESEQAVARAEQWAAQDQLRLLGIPVQALERLREQLGVDDVVLWSSSGAPLASAGSALLQTLQERPSGPQLRQLRNQTVMTQIEGLEDD